MLTLEIDRSNIQIKRYRQDQLEQATSDYAEKEKGFKDNKEKDVVLVVAPAKTDSPNLPL